MAYWFKRRRYGYGWTPSTWQGWLCVAVFLAATILPIPLLGDSTTATALYLAWTLLALAAFLALTIAKSPTARWRWGKTPADHPDEDS